MLSIGSCRYDARPDSLYLWGDEDPISYLQDGALKEAMLKRAVGGLQNSFCGHSLTSKEGFSD